MVPLVCSAVLKTQSDLENQLKSRIRGNSVPALIPGVCGGSWLLGGGWH